MNKVRIHLNLFVKLMIQYHLLAGLHFNIWLYFGLGIDFQLKNMYTVIPGVDYVERIGSIYWMQVNMKKWYDTI